MRALSSRAQHCPEDVARTAVCHRKSFTKHASLLCQKKWSIASISNDPDYGKAAHASKLLQELLEQTGQRAEGRIPMFLRAQPETFFQMFRNQKSKLTKKWEQQKKEAEAAAEGSGSASLALVAVGGGGAPAHQAASAAPAHQAAAAAPAHQAAASAPAQAAAAAPAHQAAAPAHQAAAQTALVVAPVAAVAAAAVPAAGNAASSEGDPEFIKA